MIELKVKRLDDSIPMPEYAKSGDAGFDLRATEDVTIYPGETVMVGTGLAFEIPEGCNGEVRARSGMASKRMLAPINEPGTVDSGYRGEVMVPLAQLRAAREGKLVGPGLRHAPEHRGHPARQARRAHRPDGGCSRGVLRVRGGRRADRDGARGRRLRIERIGVAMSEGPMTYPAKMMEKFEREAMPYRRPCPEFLKFRKMLDAAGIPWRDASWDDPYTPMHRTHGDGFSVIWGKGSYGAELGLLEARVNGVPDVTGHLTAAEAFKMVRGLR